MPQMPLATIRKEGPDSWQPYDRLASQCLATKRSCTQTPNMIHSYAKDPHRSVVPVVLASRDDAFGY